MKPRKTLEKALAGSKNIHFGDMVSLVESFGFSLSRVKGSHYIFTHPSVAELVNIQDRGGKVKPYQVRQFLLLIEQHNLRMEDER